VLKNEQWKRVKKCVTNRSAEITAVPFEMASQWHV